jgi:NADPH:quinone reductase
MPESMQLIEVDIAANAALLPKVLRPRGMAVVYGTGTVEAPVPLQALLTNQIVLKFIFVYELAPEERGEAIAAITRMLEDNRFAPRIALTLPLDEIAAAHEAVEAGMAGKVVVALP